MHIPFLSEFLTLATLHLAVVISPGPNLTLVAKNSVTMHFRLALYCVLGIAAGAFLHVTLAIAGLSAFVSKYQVLYLFLQFFGAGYLVYVGVKATRTKAYNLEEQVAGTKEASTARTAFSEGFINMMSNPKAYIFIFALFTQVVGATPVGIKFLYGFWMSFVDIVWFASVAYLLSRPSVKARFTAKLHLVARAFGLILIGFGVWICLSAFR